MKIANHSIDRPLGTIMIVVAMIFLGYISLVGLPIDLFPEIDFPLITVQTEYSGASPNEVEKLVTKRIEEAVTSIEDIKEITSFSFEGVSIVLIEFDWDVDLDLVAIDVREKADLVRPFLPEDAEDPIVSKFDIMSNESVIRLSAISTRTDFSKELEAVPESEREAYLRELKDKQLQDTRKYLEDEVKDQLERISGVAAARITGGLEREILVAVRPHDLEYYNLSIKDINDALSNENVDLPGGRIDETSTEFTVRTLGEFENLEDIENMIITVRGENAIYLKDVADIEDTHKEVRQYSRTNSVESVGIEVIKRSGGNSARIADAVKEEIEKINKRFTKYHIAVSVDYSQYIKDSIGMVRSNAIIGAALSIIVLLIFLRNFKSTIIIAVSIPTALVVTFFLIAQKEMTLNLLSLGGLALGVGMLLDNSIVILENIFRHINMGENRIDASKKGAQEVGIALSASTVTTLAVFVPIIFFTSGIVNQIFSDMAYTVAFSLAASLLVAVTFVPMAASRLLKASAKSRARELEPEELQSFENSEKPSKESFKIAKDFAEKLLRPMLRHRLLTSLCVILVFVGAIGLMRLFMKQEFFPKMDEGVFSVTMELGTGRSLEQTNEKTGIIEDRVSKIPSNILENYFATINTGNKPNESAISVKLVKVKERNVSTTEIVDKIREDLQSKIPGAKITVSEGEGHGPGGKPIQLVLKGDDLYRLNRTSDQIIKLISEIEGAADVDTSLRIGKPEIRVKINRKKASDMMLTVDDIATTVRKYLTGDIATSFKDLDDEIDIRVKMHGLDSLQTEDVAGLLIPLPGGNKIRLEEVAEIQEERGPVVLERKDQQRMATISSNIESGYALGEITSKINENLKDFDLPEGQSYEFSGEQKDMEESFGDLKKSLLIAIFLVYMILVAQFESLVQPFVIMVTVPLSVIGVILSCVITGTSLNIMVMLGMLMLAGIVVNNAIVLITYVNQLKASGMARREALIKGVRTRIRPILMTSLTTGCGMLPLALKLGSGAAEFYSPLAIAVIGGLIVSTIGSLLIVPVLDSIAEDFGLFIKRILTRLVVMLERTFFPKRSEDLRD